MKTYFIADTHFGDGQIIKYENRPFNSAEAMNEELINNWNNAVGEGDEVYVVGDFGTEEATAALLNRLTA